MSANEKVPAVGAEVIVRITPVLTSDKTWMVRGKMLAVRHDPSELVVGRIEITQPDGLWSGCVLDAVHNPYTADWRATQAVCKGAHEAWSKCGSIEREQ